MSKHSASRIRRKCNTILQIMLQTWLGLARFALFAVRAVIHLGRNGATEARCISGNKRIDAIQGVMRERELGGLAEASADVDGRAGQNGGQRRTAGLKKVAR